MLMVVVVEEKEVAMMMMPFVSALHLSAMLYFISKLLVRLHIQIK